MIANARTQSDPDNMARTSCHLIRRLGTHDEHCCRGDERPVQIRDKSPSRPSTIHRVVVLLPVPAAAVREKNR